MFSPMGEYGEYDKPIRITAGASFLASHYIPKENGVGGRVRLQLVSGSDGVHTTKSVQQRPKSPAELPTHKYNLEDTAF